MAGKDYTVTGRGVNEQGNSWDTQDYGPGQANDNPYHYSNKDGSYYYSNSDGSKYYNDGKGFSQYEPPANTKYEADFKQASQSNDGYDGQEDVVEQEPEIGRFEKAVNDSQNRESIVEEHTNPYAEEDYGNDISNEEENQGYDHADDPLEAHDECVDYDQEDFYEDDGGDDDEY